MSIPKPHHTSAPSVTRRNVLRAASAGALLGLGGVLVRENSTPRQRVLVHIELRGGNDALNTLVPYRDPAYFEARPQLALNRDRVTEFSQGYFWHSSLDPLRAAWSKGDLAIIQGVGVPGGNRSHFHAMDQWSSGRIHPGTPSGWLGGARIGGSDAVSLGNSPVASARTRHGPCVVIPSLQTVAGQPGLLDTATRSELRDLLTRASAGSELDGPLREGLDLADAVERARGHGAGRSGPRERLGDLSARLGLIVDLLEIGHPARSFAIAMDGFDTHALQPYQHGLLLAELASGLDSLRRRLDRASPARDVVVLVTSEFGRRVRQNGSVGTDHGLGGLAIALGTSIRGGIYGPTVDLDNLDEGDLLVQVDYRRVLGEVLRSFDRDPRELFGRDAPIEGVGFLA